MPSHRFELADPPESGVPRSHWIEHAAGFILLNDVRDYALGQMPADLTDREQQVAVEAANHALYGLMMVADGVTGGLWNERHWLSVSLSVELEDRESGSTEGLELFDSNGMCGWYHGWVEGDFGAAPVARPRSNS